ncbi:MAG: hypothetical protein WBV80_12700 [Mycobacterium sp.]
MALREPFASGAGKVTHVVYIVQERIDVPLPPKFFMRRLPGDGFAPDEE